MEFGGPTLQLVNDLVATGVNRLSLVLRHSARTFDPALHDLENPLTAEGRTLARELGLRLPKQLMLRGYASPPERCMETAQLVLAGHQERGGRVSRHRPVEALGVFYALDQMKMWRGLREAGGLYEYLSQWFDGMVPRDAMMPPELAAELVVGAVRNKLAAAPVGAHLDLCVSHDMTVALLMDRVLGQRVTDHTVAFLDAVAFFEKDGGLWARSVHGDAIQLAAHP